jgi:DNA replication protein DnaC
LRTVSDDRLDSTPDDRHGRGSTIVTSQLPVDYWHEVIVDPTIADAILDRLVHTAHRLALMLEVEVLCGP